MKPITKEEIRMFIVDRMPSDNFLLDDIEFTDEQIDAAQCVTVDKYNSTTPLLNPVTVGTFPSRYEMLIGTVSVLLKNAAINMMRNNLNYQSSEGTSINDLEKRREYLELASALSQEFDIRVKQIKVSQNAEACYGYV